ncbi:MAG: hypothetical protein LBQ87_07300 [Candidatus Fibromonas sp.]|nr:hypothetical protein [Candidatus Fibromonas sp.]
MNFSSGKHQVLPAGFAVAILSFCPLKGEDRKLQPFGQPCPEGKAGSLKIFLYYIQGIFMQAKEPFIGYVAEPPVLTISVLQNGVMDILQNFAKLNLIRINKSQDDITANLNMMRAEAAERGFLSDEEIEAEICATREDIAKQNKAL